MFPIYLCDKVVGEACLKYEGLYCQIDCLCHFKDRRRYRVIVFCGDKSMDLGICIPYKNGFGFRTNVKAKDIANGNIRFITIPAESEHFIPVDPQTPFLYLDKLRDGFFVEKLGQPGIKFPTIDR